MHQKRLTPRAAAANRRNQLGNRWSVSDDDFPQFLGNRQANLTPRPIRTDWKQRPPEIVWRREVGAGWSSFALIGPVAITQEQRGDEECVCCYELATGNQRWVHRCRAHFESVLGGDGPRATPTVHDRSVYAIGGTGILSCLDVVTGEEQWQVDTLADNNGEPVHHGVCGSPLIVDEMVVVTPTGRADASLVAYDCASGERRWRAGQWKASYSSPMLADIQGERQILIFTRDGLESHAPDDGTLLWSFPLTNSESTVCSQPVLIPDTDRQILLGLGYGKGSTLIEVTRSSGGAWQVDKKWSSKEMKTKFTTAVVLDGYAYGLDDGILSCIDVQTGKRRWKKGRYQHGQILLVGKWLIVQEEAGDVVLVRPQPDGLQELGHVAALSSKTWNNPALTGQYLLVRNDREAICFRIVE
ncbi:MAG: PQQ-binding-like beta-propeller repeat protein [Pirellulaceae bacterium]